MTNDNDPIRRGIDAIEACRGLDPEGEIATLPAVAYVGETGAYRGTMDQLRNAMTEMLRRERRSQERAILEAALAAIPAVAASQTVQVQSSCPHPTSGDETYYTRGKNADRFVSMNDADFADAICFAAQDLNDTGLGDDLDKWMPFQVMLSDAADRIKRFAASQTAETAVNAGCSQRVTVKPLDMSNLLKHAFVFGWEKSESTSSPMEYVWTEYDPTENSAYARILAAINMQPSPRDAQIAALVEAAKPFAQVRIKNGVSQAGDIGRTDVTNLRAALAAVKGGDA